MQRQFILMALPRPQKVLVDVEAVVREYLSPTVASSHIKDLPPKYEDVEDFPPQYDEHTMIVTDDQTNADRASEDITTVQKEMPRRQNYSRKPLRKTSNLLI